MLFTVLQTDKAKLNEAIEDWSNWAPNALGYSPDRKNLTKQLFDFYFKPYIQNYKNQSQWLQNFTNFLGDRIFHYGIIQSTHYERKFIPINNYFYDHSGGYSSGTVIGFSQAPIHPIVGAIWRIIQVTLYEKMLGQVLPTQFPGKSFNFDNQVYFLFYF